MMRQSVHSSRIVRRRSSSASLHQPDTLGQVVANRTGRVVLRREHTVPRASIPYSQGHRVGVAHGRVQFMKRAVRAERERMARELHDSVAQAFTAILVELRGMQETAHAAPELTDAYLDQLRALAQSGLAETRRAVHALRPQALVGCDLATALRRTVVQVTLGTTLEVDITLPDAAGPLRPSVEAEVLRIAQEAVTNTLKHAHARHLVVELSLSMGCLYLLIRDDGRGFDAAAGSGDGLRNMRARAAALGGVLSISSAAGRGTTIALTVPLASGGSDAR